MLSSSTISRTPSSESLKLAEGDNQSQFFRELPQNIQTIILYVEANRFEAELNSIIVGMLRKLPGITPGITTEELKWTLAIQNLLESAIANYIGAKAGLIVSGHAQKQGLAREIWGAAFMGAMDKNLEAMRIHEDAERQISALQEALQARRSPQTQNPDASSSTGSGFFVARGLVVTNHHVTEDCQRLRVGGLTIGRLLASDARNDLALIELERGTTDAATIRVGRVKIGEPATIAGFPLSGLLSGLNVTTGNVSSLSGIGGDIRLLQITAPVQAGNSGGPLLDANGNVMGVVVSKLNALKVARATGDVPQNVNFAINANVLSSFLDANAVNYKTASGGATLPTQEIARRAQAFTVLVECIK